MFNLGSIYSPSHCFSWNSRKITLPTHLIYHTSILPLASCSGNSITERQNIFNFSQAEEFEISFETFPYFSQLVLQYVHKKLVMKE